MTEADKKKRSIHKKAASSQIKETKLEAAKRLEGKLRIRSEIWYREEDGRLIKATDQQETIQEEDTTLHLTLTE